LLPDEVTYVGDSADNHTEINDSLYNQPVDPADYQVSFAPFLINALITVFLIIIAIAVLFLIVHAVKSRREENDALEVVQPPSDDANNLIDQ